MPYLDGVGHRNVETSMEAARRVAPIASSVMNLVRSIFQEQGHGGATADEIIQIFFSKYGHITKDRTIQARVSDLKRTGLIEALTRTNEKGEIKNIRRKGGEVLVLKGLRDGLFPL